jgi:hypothetical protein
MISIKRLFRVMVPVMQQLNEFGGYGMVVESCYS